MDAEPRATAFRACAASARADLRCIPALLQEGAAPARGGGAPIVAPLRGGVPAVPET